MQDTTKNKQNPLLSPIMIGITGHRNIRDVDCEEIKRKIGEVYTHYKQKYQNSPIMVLTSLAQGSDQIAADVAIDMGLSFVVALPMPSKDYLLNWEHKDVESFERLILQAQKVIELPLVKREDGIIHYESQYAQAGAFVAFHCHILLALWDGLTTSFEAGTYQVVNFAREGIPLHYASHVYNALDPADVSPVEHIVIPRIGQELPVAVEQATRLNPKVWNNDKELEEAFWESLQAIEQYNCEALKYHEQPNTVYFSAVSIENSTVRAQFSQFFPVERFAVTHVENKQIIDRFVFADIMALKFQKAHHWHLLLLLVLGLQVLLLLNMNHTSAFIGLPIITTGTAVIAIFLYKYYSQQKQQQEYLDFRALAEGLRVQLYWSLSGIHEDVSNYYMRQNANELQWIRYVIRAWNILQPNRCEELGDKGSAGTRMHLGNQRNVLTYWVKDQAEWYKKKATTNQTQAKRLKTVGMALIYFSVALSVLIGLFKFEIASWNFSFDIQVLINLLRLIAGLSMGTALTLFVFIEKKALPMQANLYNHAAVTFANAYDRLEKILSKSNPDQEEFRQILIAVGQRALAEHENWVRIHRERPLPLPKIG